MHAPAPTAQVLVHATPGLAHTSVVANTPVTHGPVIAAGCHARLAGQVSHNLSPNHFRKNTGVPPNPRPLELLSLQSLTLLTGFMVPRRLLPTLLFMPLLTQLAILKLVKQHNLQYLFRYLSQYSGIN